MKWIRCCSNKAKVCLFANWYDLFLFMYHFCACVSFVFFIRSRRPDILMETHINNFRLRDWHSVYWKQQGKQLILLHFQITAETLKIDFIKCSNDIFIFCWYLHRTGCWRIRQLCPAKKTLQCCFKLSNIYEIN